MLRAQMEIVARALILRNAALFCLLSLLMMIICNCSGDAGIGNFSINDIVSKSKITWSGKVTEVDSDNVVANATLVISVEELPQPAGENTDVPAWTKEWTGKTGNNGTFKISIRWYPYADYTIQVTHPRLDYEGEGMKLSDIKHKPPFENITGTELKVVLKAEESETSMIGAI